MEHSFTVDTVQFDLTIPRDARNGRDTIKQISTIKIIGIESGDGIGGTSRAILVKSPPFKVTSVCNCVPSRLIRRIGV